MLLGRDSTCAALDDLLSSLRRGSGGALVLVGPAGVGKTALLDYMAERADDLRVIRSQGVEGEFQLPYAGLSQVLTPLLHLLPSLSPGQAAAVSSALAVGPATGPDPLPSYMGTLNLLAVAASEGPVLVLVDDCHWFDDASIAALTFAGRRLTEDPVLMVLSFRATTALPPPPSGMPLLLLDGLDSDASAGLLRQRGHTVSPEVSRWLLSATGGNPLALCDLPTFATPTELTVMALTAQPAPVGPTLEAAYGRAYRTLASDAQQAALVVAVLDDVDVRVVHRALASLGLTMQALEPAEETGLLQVTAGMLRVRHPLARSAIIQIAPPRLRRAAHLAAAEGLLASSRPRHRDARVWHLAEASLGVDEATAGLLEELAQSAAGQSGYATASATYQRAAELSEGEPRVRRLVAAAESAFNAGEGDQCRQLLQQAVEEAGNFSPSLEVINHLQGRLDTWSADPADAARVLQGQAERVRERDPLLCLKLSVDATAAAALSGQLRLASELAESVNAVAEGLGPGVGLVADLLVGGVRAMRGDGNDALPLLDRCRAAFDVADGGPERLQQLIYLATSYHFIDAFDQAIPLFGRAIALGRELCAIGQLPFALAHSASSKYRLGDWKGAYADATDALGLAEESGRVVDRPIALIMLGMIEAARGDDRARERAEAAIREGTAMGARFVVAQGLSVLGLLELGQGRAGAAIIPLQRCRDMAVELELMELGYLQWAAELVEARTRSGDVPSARQIVQIMQDATHPGTTAIDRALLARSQALIAPHGAWEDEFKAALTLHEEAGTRPFELARTQLCFGERLRRNRRRKDARTQLTAAWEGFSRLGATCWTERASGELRATGSVVGAPIAQRADLLTPQEFQVAQAAVAGATNREIADALFLSQKTVEFHLSAIYRRLGLRSRAELKTLLNSSQGLSG